MIDPVYRDAAGMRRASDGTRREFDAEDCLGREPLGEMSYGLAEHGIPIQHFVLHTDQATLRDRIQNDKDLGPSTLRFAYMEPYAEATHTWLHNEAEVIDTTHTTPDQAAQQIADSVLGR